MLSTETPRAKFARLVGLLALSAVAIAATAVWYLRYGPPLPGSRLLLAVLPFDNASGDPSERYFSDGFTADLAATLGRSSPDHLTIVAYTTSQRFKAMHAVDEIRPLLGVEYVLDGKVSRSNGRIKVTARLLRTRDMSEVWAGGSERDLDSVAVLERDVVASVGRALAISVTSARVEVPLAAAAYDEYLRGKACLDQATPVSVREAIDHFERAVAAGGNYASAHAGLAEAYQRLAAPGWEIEPPANLYEKARFHADRALAINPRLSEALAVRTMIRMFYEWDRERPLGDMLDTIYANPSYAPAQQYYAAILTALGRVDEAVLAAQRGVNLNRLSPSASAALGIAEYYAGHNSDAIAQLSTALSLDDASATTHWGLGQAYRASGDAARAIAELQRATELAGWSGFLRAHLAYTLAVAGQRDRALAVQREIDAQGGYVPPYHRALIAAGLGDQQAMMRALEQALADRSGWIMLLPAQPEFAAVRDRAEFKQLFARARPMP